MVSFPVARWSRYLIYAILATLPLERIPSFELTDPVTATIRISQVLGLILILMNLPAMWRTRRQFLRPPWVWLGVFWLVCLLSAGLAGDMQRALIVVAYTVFVGLLAWVVALRFEIVRLATYAKILIGAALATCAFGLYQFFGDMLGLSPQLTGLAQPYTSAVFGFPRVQSTGLEPLYFDNFLLIPIGLVVGYLVYRAGPSWRLWGALAFMATIVFVNVSRGAMVAMLLLAIMGMGVAMWRRQVRPIGLIASGIIVAGLAATGLIALGSEIAKTKTTKSEQAVKNFTKQATNVSQGQSAVFRTLSREQAVKLWLEAPVLGVGPGNFGRAAHEKDPKVFKNSLAIVNNEPLEILAETGIVGLGAVLLFAFALMRLFVMRLRETVVRPEVQAWSLGLGLGLVAIAAQYMTFSTLYITHIWVAIGLFVGVMTAVLKPGKRAAS